MNDLLILAVKIVIVLYSVVIHELSHGLMANSLGDPTAKRMGRLTLNPIRHLDIFGSIILPLLLYIVPPHLVFGYAKPVPYNPLLLRDKKLGPAKVAFAGPISNIVLALLFGLVMRFMPFLIYSSVIQELFVFIIWINLAMAIVSNIFSISSYHRNLVLGRFDMRGLILIELVRPLPVIFKAL